MIKAIYKRLVRKVTIDCSYPMDIFLDIVATILKQARKGRRKLDILICSSIEDNFKVFESLKLKKSKFGQKRVTLRSTPFSAPTCRISSGMQKETTPERSHVKRDDP